MGATEKRASNTLFSFYLIIFVGPTDFGPTTEAPELKHFPFFSMA
jgi:hypothetical protein